MSPLRLALCCLVAAACEVPRAVPVAAALQPVNPFRASCATPALGVCTEYGDEAFALGEARLRIGCEDARGLWSPARCAAERRLGTCVTPGRTRVYYPGGALDFSSTTAARDCVELYQGVFHAHAPPPSSPEPP